MFQDEARFGRISEARYAWAPYPERPMVCASHIREYSYAYAAVCPHDGIMDSLVLPWADTRCMDLFLAEVAQRHPDDFIVMVLDGAGWHRAQALRIPPRMGLLFLPPYSPELNPVEHLWDELREKNFHNRAFASLDAVELHLCSALRGLEQDPERVRSITGWDWIINIILNAD
jgi:transposase